MDFSKLDQHEKLAIYGSAAVILAGLISNWGGLLFLSILAAIGMLVVIFLPQFSSGTTLPGSKGTLMAVLGLVAAAGAVITALPYLGLLGALLGEFSTILFLIAVIGALVMAWAGWQELQGEGGKWAFGTSHAAASSPAAAPAVERPADPAPQRDVDAAREPERTPDA